MRAIWVLVIAACDAGAKPVPPPPAPKPTPPPIPVQDHATAPVSEELAIYLKRLDIERPVAVIDTSAGTLHCQLFPDEAPLTVANFIGLAMGWRAWLDPKTHELSHAPFYDGLTFHRVIPDFMIQGGDPLGNGTGGPGYQFKNETPPGSKITTGTLAMANAGPDTNGSQFFIMQGDRPDLSGKHTEFGHCYERELVKVMASVPRGRNDKPVTPIVITHISFTPPTSYR